MLPLFDSPELPLLLRKVKLLDSRGLHSFSYYTLDCYFRINELIIKRKLKFLTPTIISVEGKYGMFNKKVFVYSHTNEDIDMLQSLQQKELTIYSINKIDLAKETKCTEICYELKSVFDPQTYSTAKKRYQKISYPFTWLEKSGFKIGVIHEFTRDIRILHDTWVKAKLSDSKLYRIMFPTSRYLYCVNRALLDQQSYVIFGAWYREVLVAVRVVGINSSYAYDMAFFGDFWSTPSQTMNYIDIFILKELMVNNNILYFNCGCVLNKNLQQFKTHLPFSNSTYYKYSNISES